MYWENIVFDAESPKQHGEFWENLLKSQMLTDDAGGYETRLQLPGSRYLDLCFPTVQDPDRAQQRVYLILGTGAHLTQRLGNAHQDALESRLDAAGNEFLLSARDEEASGLVLEALQLACADPADDAEFWKQLLGWEIVARSPMALAHPSGAGPRLVLVSEGSPKATAKNAIHLDLRLEQVESMEDALGTIRALGGKELDRPWGTLPWRVFQDRSGNEFCVLPASPSHR
ncbi:VOC family protein [Glutamicibacter sp.]|uniref:VOC family protein n=1 Tax=Glutamicibacter sp. TaxID=1931995 RepID=UPI003D6A5589